MKGLWHGADVLAFLENVERWRPGTELSYAEAAMFLEICGVWIFPVLGNWPGRSGEHVCCHPVAGICAAIRRHYQRKLINE